MREGLMAAMLALTVVFAGIGFAHVGQTATGSQLETETPSIPDCEEDSAGLLRGLGDYSDGRFERYECVHVDEFGTMALEDIGIARAFAAAICKHPEYFERNLGVWLVDNLPDSSTPVC